MKILITGASGFIGKNLQLYLKEVKDIEVVCFTREQSLAELTNIMKSTDFVFHLAGVNRPQDLSEFKTGNTELTYALCSAIAQTQRNIPVVYTSSTQAILDNPYGESKRLAETALFELKKKTSNSVYIFRLPNVFGKWCKPDYNSAVATFCHNIARDIPIQINDENAQVQLVYIDDVVGRFIELLKGANSAINSEGFEMLSPQYLIAVGELARQIKAFKESRKTMITEPVGNGLIRALYSTYLSYLPKEFFAYSVPMHSDVRGVFVEMLKTRDSGQFSYFTARPGVTRGGHYHHSKTEKFLVISGQACFKFRHMLTGEAHEVIVHSTQTQIVETVPGWTHDITNIGHDELIVMLWANEIFDRANPDTYSSPI